MDFTQKYFGLLLGKFGMFVRGAFHSTCTEDHFGKKSKLSRKQVLFVSFGFRAEKNLIFDDNFSALFSKLHSESVELIRDLFSTNNIDYLLRDLSKKLLEFWSEILGKFVKTAFYYWRISLTRNQIIEKNIFSYLFGLGEEFNLTTDNVGSDSVF